MSSNRSVVMVSGQVPASLAGETLLTQSDIRTGDGGALEKTPFGNFVPRKHVQAGGFRVRTEAVLGAGLVEQSPAPESDTDGQHGGVSGTLRLFLVVRSIASPCSRPNPERMAPGLVGLAHERRRPCSVRWLLSRLAAHQGSTGESHSLAGGAPFRSDRVSDDDSFTRGRLESGPSRRGPASVNVEPD